MGEMKRYLACSTGELERMTKPALFALMQEAFPEVQAPDTRANMIAALKKARSDHWNGGADQPRPKPTPARNPGLISAAEANEWLRTLPRLEAL